MTRSTPPSPAGRSVTETGTWRSASNREMTSSTTATSRSSSDLAVTCRSARRWARASPTAAKLSTQAAHCFGQALFACCRPRLDTQIAVCGTVRAPGQPPLRHPPACIRQPVRTGTAGTCVLPIAMVSRSTTFTRPSAAVTHERGLGAKLAVAAAGHHSGPAGLACPAEPVAGAWAGGATVDGLGPARCCLVWRITWPRLLRDRRLLAPSGRASSGPAAGLAAG